MSFLKNNKKVWLQTKKIEYKQKRWDRNKNKMLQTKTDKVANKIYHIVQNKLLQTEKVLQTKRRCKLKNVVLRYKLQKRLCDPMFIRGATNKKGSADWKETGIISKGQEQIRGWLYFV